MMEEWEDPEVMMHSYLHGNFRRKSVGLQWTLCEHCDVSQVTRELETPLKEGTAGESWWGVRQNSGAVAPVEMMSPPPPHPAAASVVHSNK